MILNSEQQAVVNHPGGPLLVLACPGSGKTRCITERIISLLDDDVPPSAILAVTFTNKAANEMKERIRQRGYGHNLMISTFHSFCVKMLRKYAGHLGYKRNFSIVDASDQLSIMRRIIRSNGLDPRDKKNDPKKFIRALENKKSLLIPDGVFEMNLKPIEISIFNDYQKTLKKTNSMDFSDLIYLTVRLFQDNETIQETEATRFKHILVDEMQDTNVAQLSLVKRLASVHNNIIVVGDADQSIYSWRNACVDNIIKFENHFEGAKTTHLSLNYRCTPEILSVAEQLISVNSDRQMIKLRAHRGSGVPVQTLESDSPELEAEAIADQIEEQRFEGYDYQDMAILCRTNMLTRTFEECFRRRNIPYVLIGAFGFYDRKEIKTAISYMKFLANPEDALAFEDIVNTPSRGIGSATVLKILEYAEENDVSFLDACRKADQIKRINKKTIKSLNFFIKAIELYDPKDPHDSLTDVFEETGFLDHLRATDRENNEFREDNVLELLRTFNHYCVTSSKPTLDKYLQDVMLMSSSDADSEDDAVKLMTVHAAKGLEFHVVFIPALEEESFPHKRVIMENNIEEERRVAYVAMTRAKDHLYLSRSKTRNLHGSAIGALPSRFLVETGLAESPY